MKIYVVRHGESTFNTTSIYQPHHAALSELGQKQAASLGARFKHIPVDIIFSSDYIRAHHTAEQISLNTQKPIQIIEDLREAKKPTEIVGRHHKDPKSLEYETEALKNIEDPNWHYLDEENFHDFRTRVSRLLDFLSKQPNENIVIVTHSLVIRMIVALVLLTEEFLTPQAFNKLKHGLKTTNTGITILEKKPEDHIIRLKVYNDIAHLGE